MGYCFDILRNESRSTDKSSEHHGPWSALDLVSVLGFCLLEFELCTLKATTGLVPVWALKKSQSRMPLRLNNAILVCSNYIPHTFNPCGDVTMSYPLWLALRNKILVLKDYISSMYPGKKVKMKVLFRVVCQGSLLEVFLQGKQVVHHTSKLLVYRLLRVV